MAANNLTAQRLRELFGYDPETGEFTRKQPKRGGRRSAPGVVGWVESTGYKCLSVDGQSYLAHRAAWLHMTGAWPLDCIDHIDGDRLNNRWANLRDVSRTINAQNIRRPQADNRSGFLGAMPHQGRFRAGIKAAGKMIYLGMHDTPEEAHEAYLEAKRRLHPGNTL